MGVVKEISKLSLVVVKPTFKRLGLLLAVTLFVSGCNSKPAQSTIEQPDITGSLDQAIATNKALPPQKTKQDAVAMPDNLDDMSLTINPDDESVSEARFDVSADSVQAAQFFKDLVGGSDINIMVDPEITGTMTLHLANVTVEETLNAIRDSYGFDYQKTNYGYRILADRLITKIFNLNYLNVTRSGTSDTGITGSQISSQGQQASQVSTSHSSDFWANLQATLQLIVSEKPGRSVVINPQAGIVVARANPEELRSIELFLELAETSLQKQVIIEARILEVSLTDDYQAGINWNTFANDLARTTTDQLAGQFEGGVLGGVNELDGVFNLNINEGDFSALIQLLQAQGEVQVLSSPRISTVNNQKAVIKVGTDEFFVTNVTPSSGEEGSQAQVSLSPFFSGIALDVTPQIGENDHVILHVRPSVTEVEEKTKVITVEGDTFELPLAASTIREADSIIRARSGQIVVIGGLLQNRSDNSEAGLPVLSRIPGIKNLFGQTRKAQRKSELVILLQPVVTNDAVWEQELTGTLERFNQ